MGQRVLVTGGAGFIGSHIVDRLRAGGHKPFVVDDLSSGVRENLPSDVPFFQADVRDADALARIFEEAKPAWVCHQAAQMSVSRSVREPAFDAAVNVVGLLNVLELSAEQGVERFVFASSGGVLYGNVFVPAGEDHPAEPISPYGISKWAGERYLEFFAAEHGLASMALRYANVYGPRQNPHGEAGVVAIFCTQMLAGRRATIHGDGRIVRDFVYVEDVADANVRALACDPPAGYAAVNIGTSQATTVNDLAKSILGLSTVARQELGRTGDVPEPQHGAPRAGDLQSSLVDPSRAKQLLAWEPRTDIGEGLQKTVAWFAERIQ